MSLPNSPTGVAAAIGVIAAQNTITWLPNNPADGVISYNLYWSNVANVTTSSANLITGLQDVADAVNTYIHLVDNSNDVFYIITAINASGESLPSVEFGTSYICPLSGESVVFTPTSFTITM